MKWAVIGASPEEKWRYGKFNEALGSKHEMAFVDWKEDGDIEAMGAGFEHVRWGETVQPLVMKRLKVQSAWTALLGITDGMVFREGRWWPLCACYEALCTALTAMGEELDPGSSAFISGTGAWARAGVGALFRCGYKKFRIAATESGAGEAMIRDMQVKFFGLELEAVPMKKIVLLAGVSSLFLNTISERLEPELARETSYLNFLKRPGAVVDTNTESGRTVLMKEAAHSSIPMLGGWSLAERTDALWAKWAFSQELKLSYQPPETF